jgi:hypothetical protein
MTTFCIAFYMSLIFLRIIPFLEIRESRKRAKNGYGEEAEEGGGPDETAAGPGEKRRYLVNSATKARERFHRNEGGHAQGGAPSGFGGRPNMDEDEEEDYHHSGSDRVSTSGRCKGICFFMHGKSRAVE